MSSRLITAIKRKIVPTRGSRILAKRDSDERRKACGVWR